MVMKVVMVMVRERGRSVEVVLFCFVFGFFLHSPRNFAPYCPWLPANRHPCFGMRAG